MKKALLAALCFIFAGFMLVNGAFALPDLQSVFESFLDWGEQGLPEAGGSIIDVELVSGGTSTNLYPGGSVSRNFHVDNEGSKDVYFRLVYAVQYDEKSWNNLTINFNEGFGFTEHDWQDISISGTPYKMKVFTYNNALSAGKSSSEVSISIAMNTAVTSEDLSRYRADFLQTQVLAIESQLFNNKGYTTAVAALDAALPLGTLNPF